MQDIEVLSHINFDLKAYFFKDKDYDLSKSLAEIPASEAYRVYFDADLFRKRNYGFIWKMETVGRLVITLKRKGSYHISMDVVQLRMALGRGQCVEVHYEKVDDDYQQMEIHAVLDARYFDSDRLRFPSPCVGDVGQRYCPLNVVLDLEINNNPNDIRTFKHTVYCCVRQNRRMPLRAVGRACINGWRAFPSGIKIPVVCLGVCGKLILKWLAAKVLPIP